MQVETRVESSWLRRLKLKCDNLLSGFASNFSLRRYMKVLATRSVTPLTAAVTLSRK